MDFSLLAQWPTEVTSYGHHDAGKYIFLPANKVPHNNKSQGHSLQSKGKWISAWTSHQSLRVTS